MDDVTSAVSRLKPKMNAARKTWLRSLRSGDRVVSFDWCNQQVVRVSVRPQKIIAGGCEYTLALGKRVGEHCWIRPATPEELARDDRQNDRRKNLQVLHRLEWAYVSDDTLKRVVEVLKDDPKWQHERGK